MLSKGSNPPIRGLTSKFRSRVLNCFRKIASQCSEGFWLSLMRAYYLWGLGLTSRVPLHRSSSVVVRSVFGFGVFGLRLEGFRFRTLEL